MVKQVQQHQLEDLSRPKHQLLLPRNWVVRDKEKDYGIDVEVEIFEGIDATGLVYWVQLKATETEDEKNAKKIDFSIDTLEYYKSLDIPVLIARYSEKQDEFYCKWSNEIDLFYAKEGAKTIRVTFQDSDKWNDATPQKIQEDLMKLRDVKSGVIKLPISIHLEIEENTINGVSRGVFLSSYRVALKRHLSVVKHTNNSEESYIVANLTNKSLTINLSFQSKCTFHNINTLPNPENFQESLITNILLGVIVVLFEVGQGEMAARIFLEEALKYTLIQNKEVISKLFPMLISTSHYGEIINLVCEVIESNKDDNFLESVATSSLLATVDRDDPVKMGKFQKY